ncbi:TonB-dependent receptor plug domain-containing protein [Sphingomonas sp. MMS24-JH45]
MMARFRMLALGCSLAALVAGNASAQQPRPRAGGRDQPRPEPEASTADNGDVVVTARFRTEAVRDVPIAITAISGKSLANRQLNNVETISAAIPAVGFRGGASNKDRTVFIRGVGTITTSPGVEPSVSTVLDGVVLSRPGQSTLDLGELERIEVLRGPQGTLLGKNASAGVVNIVTREPSEDFQAFGELGATTDKDYRVKAESLGALVPGKVRALIGGLYSDFGGNAFNVVTQKDINTSRRYGVRGKLLLTPIDTLKVTAIADYLNTRETVSQSVFISSGRRAYPSGLFTDNAALASELAAVGVVPSPRNNRAATDVDSFVRDEETRRVADGGSRTRRLRRHLDHRVAAMAERPDAGLGQEDSPRHADLRVGLSTTAASICASSRRSCG